MYYFCYRKIERHFNEKRESFILIGFAFLLLLSAKLCGYRGDRHISLASLIEFIHTATLLHDDVVDRAQLRRGSLSANSIWGNEACVLVGDFLFTKCFSLMVENDNLKILRTISRATTLMAEGELDELIKTDDLSLTEEGYLSIIARKTGALISAAAQIGAILGNASEEKEETSPDWNGCRNRLGREIDVIAHDGGERRPSPLDTERAGPLFRQP
jgi:geranylgeranyl pyrophosphate synthase